MADPERYEEVKIGNWRDLVAQIEALSDRCVFRGQQRASWTMQTTLERHKPSSKPAPQVENTLLREFPRRADLYVKVGQRPETPGEWLSLMQHFGAPTRLLDVTRSPYVAAYFAVEGANDDGEHRAIWAIDTLWCTEMVGRIMLAKIPGLEEELKKKTLPVPVEYAGASLLSGLFAELVLKNIVVGVFPFEPDRISERLSVQQGLFLCPTHVEKTFQENLDALGSLRTGIKKLVIDDGERADFLKHLRLMNITSASLFPGLDGYARSFREMLVEESEDHRRRRMVIDALGVHLHEVVSVVEHVTAASKTP